MSEEMLDTALLNVKFKGFAAFAFLLPCLAHDSLAYPSFLSLFPLIYYFFHLYFRTHTAIEEGVYNRRTRQVIVRTCIASCFR